MRVMKVKGWPLSQEELKKAKQALFPRISFVNVLNKYTRHIEEVGSSTFTHRCVCPNPNHKNGGERTPSFYFSDEDKGYRCYGCGITGDVFDLIALMNGMPWGDVVRVFLDKENIDVNSIDFDFSAPNQASLSQYSFDCNMKLSKEFREYLNALKNSPNYEVEKGWADLTFRRIDDALDKAESKQSIKELEMQTLMDLERKKLQLKR